MNSLKPMAYRIDGTPYSDLQEWAKDFENTKRRIGLDHLWWGGEVSTIWLGLDHSFLNGPPLIFETMVFYKNFRELDMARYSTKKEAMEGHKKMVRKWKWRAWIKLLRFE